MAVREPRCTCLWSRLFLTASFVRSSSGAQSPRPCTGQQVSAGDMLGSVAKEALRGRWAPGSYQEPSAYISQHPQSSPLSCPQDSSGFGCDVGRVGGTRLVLLVTVPCKLIHRQGAVAGSLTDPLASGQNARPPPSPVPGVEHLGPTSWSLEQSELYLEHSSLCLWEIRVHRSHQGLWKMLPGDDQEPLPGSSLGV